MVPDTYMPKQIDTDDPAGQSSKELHQIAEARRKKIQEERQHKRALYVRRQDCHSLLPFIEQTRSDARYRDCGNEQRKAHTPKMVRDTPCTRNAAATEHVNVPCGT